MPGMLAILLGQVAAAPPVLSVPSGAVMKVSLEGRGMQVYTCAAKAGIAAYGWTFTAPSAVLVDPQGGDPEGRHYAGPTWEAIDGSRVIGHLRAKSPSPGEEGVDWLLFDGTPSGQGEFGRIVYVRRVATRGGKMPTTGCDADHLGETEGVPYSATYEFYTAGG